MRSAAVFLSSSCGRVGSGGWVSSFVLRSVPEVYQSGGAYVRTNAPVRFGLPGAPGGLRVRLVLDVNGEDCMAGEVNERNTGERVR